MFWFIFIGLLVLGYIIKFFIDLNKDNEDLKEKSLEEKFGIIVNFLNQNIFKGQGETINVDKREFNLGKRGSNSLVKFHYSTGHLTIIYKTLYLEKEFEFQKQYNDLRNISALDQQRIGKEILDGMSEEIDSHLKKHIPFKQDKSEKIDFMNSEQNSDEVILEIRAETENSGQKHKFLTDKNEIGLNRDVKSVKHTFYNMYGLKTDLPEFDVKRYTNSNFDFKGNLKEEVDHVIESNYIKRRIHYYSDSGEKIEVICLKDDVYESKIVFSYDDSGNRISEEETNSKGITVMKKSHIYDELGRILRTNYFFNYVKVLESFSTYKYDHHGNNIGYENFDLDNNLTWSVKRIYDDFRNVIEEKHYDENGFLVNIHYFKYQFDNHLNWIMKTERETYSPSLRTNQRRDITYFDNVV
jgi:hypothetical protein